MCAGRRTPTLVFTRKSKIIRERKNLDILPRLGTKEPRPAFVQSQPDRYQLPITNDSDAQPTPDPSITSPQEASETSSPFNERTSTVNLMEQVAFPPELQVLLRSWLTSPGLPKTQCSFFARYCRRCIAGQPVRTHQSHHSSG